MQNDLDYTFMSAQHVRLYPLIFKKYCLYSVLSFEERLCLSGCIWPARPQLKVDIRVGVFQADVPASSNRRQTPVFIAHAITIHSSDSSIPSPKTGCGIEQTHRTTISTRFRGRESPSRCSLDTFTGHVSVHLNVLLIALILSTTHSPPK